MRKEEYDKWVEEAKKFVIEKGREIDIFPRVMQSAPPFGTDIHIMFLGHDGHDGGKFPEDSQKLNDEFYKGNEGWPNRNSWPIWSNLYNYGFKPTGNTMLMDEEEHMLFTNAVFFTGDKINQVNASVGKEIVDRCMKLTADLAFNVVKPKLLLCFSVDNVFKPLIKAISGVRIIVPKFKPYGIKFNCIMAKYNDTVIIGMPHPSGAYGVLSSLQNIAKLINLVYHCQDEENIKTVCLQTVKSHD